MPKLSDSMEEGKIVEWKVEEGAEVRAGDVLAQVESDKAVMDLECFRDGTVVEILKGDGAEVPVGELIARIREEGEEEAEAPAEAEAEEEVEEQEEAEEEAPEEAEAPEAEAEEEEEEEAEAKPRARERRRPIAPAEKPAIPRKRVAISPYAAKIAEQKDIDYTDIQGTGPGGRIIADDIERAAKERTGEQVEEKAPEKPREPTPADEELPPLELEEGEAEVEEAPFRLKTQARRVMASQHVIPHFYVTRGVDATELLARKDEVKERYGATVTHLVILACLRALKQHPEINRSYDRGRIIKWNGVNMGIAVDTDQGLTVAVLHDAQDLCLEELAERSGELVERARAGKLNARERSHATFTVTNLGMLDVEHFEPIINPPSSVTLAVASALPAPVVREETIRIGRVMKLTAACDHRIVEGAAAARFLSDVRALLESPDDLLEGR